MTSIDGRAAHIALVLHDFSGGGSERIAIRLAQRWAEAGRRITIVAGTEAGVARALADGLAVVEFRRALTRDIPDRLRFGHAAASMVARLAPDVVVSPGNWHVPTFIAMRLAGMRLPVVAKISNPIRVAERGPPGQRLLNAWFARATRHYAALVAMSPALAAEAEAVLGRRVATVAEPNLSDDWTGAPPRTLASSATRTLVAAGRLMPQKDFGLAFETLAALGPEWRLDLLGDGRERGRLEARAAALGVADRVTFAGHVPSVAPYLARADALLCTSRYEGYPAVLIEALAAGVPVVTTPCSAAVPEILCHPSFGRVAAPTAAALSATVQAVAGTVPDPSASSALLMQHRIGHSAAAWLTLLDRVVADG
ncbi:glycosyltransferase [Polymorphobacter sp. PAMC 29334]|uniref:glycosyltransferase n=1 Tax=Polymorphobacter sp. PAMC 29334 TaxID=2862331 RepID=UPI001C676EFD|nr:glycosyltransferase [Polymorphobacter sp. PAMC 29334]QYE35008.1 glycosyltransferase [Polymorphobacter sp. PAMC 29334]